MIPVGDELHRFLSRYNIDPAKVSVELKCDDERTMRLVQSAVVEEARNQLTGHWRDMINPPPPGPSSATIYGIKFEWTYTSQQYRDAKLYPSLPEETDQ